jgi:hypothetical protein
MDFLSDRLLGQAKQLARVNQNHQCTGGKRRDFIGKLDGFPSDVPHVENIRDR